MIRKQLAKKTFSVLAVLAISVTGFSVLAQERPNAIKERLESSRDPGIYEGTLDRELTPNDTLMNGSVLRAMPDQDRTTWQIDPGVRSAESVTIGLIGRDPLQAFVVVPSDGPAQFLADLNADKVVDDAERFVFGPSTKTSEPTPGVGSLGIIGETTVAIPWKEGLFSAYPLLFRLSRAKLQVNGQEITTRMLQWNMMVSLRGSVVIEEQLHPLAYSLSFSSPEVDPRNGGMGIDANGDQELDMGLTSPEWAMAKDETVVFRVGNRYLSFQEIDPAAGKVILRSHEESDYQRIELVEGVQVPDFEFVDFEGQQRRLSDFAGKYVFLDFWGSWCGPCVGEFPHLARNYLRFRDRGFEILGINADPHPNELRNGAGQQALLDGLEKARAVVEKYEPRWTHARTESVTDLITKRFRIFGFPTAVLIDPERRILMADQQAQFALRGENLERTLERFLPD